MLTTIIFIIAAYLLGSINSAILVSRLLNLPDPRSQGSGNPGTTNVLRTGGKIPALIVLFIDILKGALAVMIARMIGLADISIAIVALAAIVGHMLPLYFRFQGGKGVATFIGVLFAINWLLGLGFIVVWLLVASISRYSSLAALVATLCAPFLALWLTNWHYAIVLLLVAGLIFYRHRGNIVRLRSGNEKKIKFKKSTT